MKKLIIIGAGDFGKEVAWLIEDINKYKPTYKILGFLDDDENKIGDICYRYKVLDKTSYLDIITDKDVYAVIAMQNSNIRQNIVDKYPNFNRWETLIHPNANISDTVKYGKGCIFCSGTVISVDTVIGEQCIFNINTTVGHDCTLGDYVSLMSGAVVSGHVSISQHAYLSSNCSIIPGRKIGEHSKVGAGSVVVRNVKNDITVMGVPAKMIKFS